MDTVSFTRMDQGTREDYALIDAALARHKAATHADNVLNLLKAMRGETLGFKIDRYQHSLQTATRARRDGADAEMQVVALLHDIGDVIAPDNHSEAAAAALRPYVSETNYWLLKHHGLFQGYFYFHHYDQDRNARDRHRGHPAFEATAEFCERWDQTSFDPAYDTLPLEAFEPLVREILAREPRYSA